MNLDYIIEQQEELEKELMYLDTHYEEQKVSYITAKLEDIHDMANDIKRSWKPDMDVNSEMLITSLIEDWFKTESLTKLDDLYKSILDELEHLRIEIKKHKKMEGEEYGY